MAARKCHGTTKAGKPCRAIPFRPGSVIDEVTVTGEWCRTHDPDLPDSARIQGAQPGAGRPRVPGHAETARLLVEQNVIAVQRPYWRALGFDVRIGENGPEVVEMPGAGAKLYGESKDGEIVMTDHDDVEAMQKAAERLQDRVFGRPRQSTEIVAGENGGAVILIAPPDQTEKSKRAAELLQGLGQV